MMYYRNDPPGPAIVLAILAAALTLAGVAGCAVGWIAREVWRSWR